MKKKKKKKDVEFFPSLSNISVATYFQHLFSKCKNN